MYADNLQFEQVNGRSVKINAFLGSNFKWCIRVWCNYLNTKSNEVSFYIFYKTNIIYLPCYFDLRYCCKIWHLKLGDLLERKWILTVKHFPLIKYQTNFLYYIISCFIVYPYYWPPALIWKKHRSPVGRVIQWQSG